MNESLLLTVDEAANRLRLGRSVTYRLVMSGELASVKIGGSRRVPVKALEEFINRQMAEQSAGGSHEPRA